MYKVKVFGHFSGAHNLRGYKGKCEELHGHNWKVEVAASSEKLDDLGMVIDFTELKKSLKACLSGLDHKYLNDIEYFKDNNPTSENMAKYIFDRVSEIRKDVKIDSVTVWETETSSATYSA
ncbi:MAG: 6-carboxytetrahydropterin synthase QueD [Candidatus Omnitrophica bacterium]|nr:6-carboxytetrahydropterin synthase QueD [Candidatus Omnitrophota bacterium]